MDYINAFIIGGILCAIGQILVDKTNLTPARILVSYVVAGVIFELFGIYQPLIDFAGAGATVPLTGFGANLFKGVVKAINQKGLIGVLSGGFIAGATGLGAAVIFGLLSSVVFSPKTKS